MPQIIIGKRVREFCQSRGWYHLLGLIFHFYTEYIYFKLKSTYFWYPQNRKIPPLEFADSRLQNWQMKTVLDLYLSFCEYKLNVIFCSVSFVHLSRSVILDMFLDWQQTRQRGLLSLPTVIDPTSSSAVVPEPTPTNTCRK